MAIEGPEDICGYVLEPDDFPVDVEYNPDSDDQWRRAIHAVTCLRDPWVKVDSGRCIWHDDSHKKSVEDLKENIDKMDTRIYGAILRRTDVSDSNLLNNMKLFGADLAGANFKNSYLINTDLRVANLVGANLQNADLRASRLRGSKLCDVSCKDTYLKKSRGKQADLSNSIFTQSDLSECKFPKANLAESNFQKSNLAGVNLKAADLSGSNFRGADLLGANMNRTKLKGADFEDANLRYTNINDTGSGGIFVSAEVNFKNCNLSKSELIDSQLGGSDFIGANLQEANLRDSDLAQADLTDADLRGADLTDTNLRYTDLTDADLRGADLTDADLRYADLTSANLQGAELSGVALNYESIFQIDQLPDPQTSTQEDENNHADNNFSSQISEIINQVKSIDEGAQQEVLTEAIKGIDKLSDSIEIIELSNESPAIDFLTVDNIIEQGKITKAVSELKTKIRNGESKNELIRFFKDHPFFFGNEYIEPSDGIRKLNNRIAILEKADIVLRSVNHYIEFIEIRQPNEDILRWDKSRENWVPTSELTKDISRMQYYINETEKEQDKIKSYSDIKAKAVKPRGKIVAGFDLTKDKRRDLRIIASHFNRVNVLTYDDILKRGKRMKEYYKDSGDVQVNRDT